MFDEFKPIDVDTHLTEPRDVWTSRISSKWGDLVPHVKNVDGMDLWFIRDEMVGGPGFVTLAGHNGSYPNVPKRYEDIPAASYDSHARLKFMDEEGIYAQVLYPNVGGFGSGGFLKIKEPTLMIDCVKAYNDFLADWCAADPKRLLGGAAIPFWDVKEAIKEVERSAKLGHKTILACTKPEDFGMPRLAHPHWDPFWAAVQDTNLPVSFHIGGGNAGEAFAVDASQMGMKAHMGAQSTLLFMANISCLTEVLFGGICHRFPKLKLFSVESGIGWLPSFLELCDWQFINGEVRNEHPEYNLLPSEYFKRQCYASFWFETKRAGIDHAIDELADNIMWETDYPHPTSQSPGLKEGWAMRPRDYVEKRLNHIAPEKLKKVFHTTAAKVFNLG